MATTAMLYRCTAVPRALLGLLATRVTVSTMWSHAYHRVVSPPCVVTTRVCDATVCVMPPVLVVCVPKVRSLRLKCGVSTVVRVVTSVVTSVVVVMTSVVVMTHGGKDTRSGVTPLNTRLSQA